MIDSITMMNFKCFEEQTVPLSAVNVFAGLNGSGKSSVIQSLLLLRQTRLSAAGKPESLRWHGTLVDLGSFRDALYERSDNDQIALETGFASSHRVSIVIGETDSGGVTLMEGEGFPSAHNSSLYRDAMFYLGADRLGPQKTLPFLDQEYESHTPLGKGGEFVLWYLEKHDNRVVPERLRYVEAPKDTLLEQVTAWLGVISPGVALRIDSMPNADLALASFSFSQENDVLSRPFRATNVGFGLSYALPVIVALLSARSDDLVMIENPEAHLHPAGQTKLAELAARAAAAGAQIILETHSDHILDGIRLAVRNGIIAPAQTAFHYFQRTDLSVEVKTPSIRKDGRLDFWPDGFFDQHERNLAALVAPR